MSDSAPEEQGSEQHQEITPLEQENKSRVAREDAKEETPAVVPPAHCVCVQFMEKMEEWMEKMEDLQDEVRKLGGITEEATEEAAEGVTLARLSREVRVVAARVGELSYDINETVKSEIASQTRQMKIALAAREPNYYEKLLTAAVVLIPLLSIVKDFKQPLLRSLIAPAVLCYARLGLACIPHMNPYRINLILSTGIVVASIALFWPQGLFKEV